LPLLWTNAGTVERLQGHAAAAEEAFQRASRLDKDDWLAERGLGLLALSGGDPADAAVHLQRSVDAGARGPLTAFALGQALLASGDVPDAVAPFREAGAAPWLVRQATASTGLRTSASADPEPLLRQATGSAGLRTSASADPEPQLRTSASDDPEPQLRTSASADPEPLPRASASADPEPLLRLALEVDPGEQDAELELANLYLAQSRYDEARLALHQAADLSGSGQAQARLMLGLMNYWLDGDLPKAEAEVEEAARLEPNSAAPVHGMADMLADSGTGGQTDWQVRAHELQAKAAVPDDSLGRAYEALGLWPQAAAEYTRIAQADPLGQYDLGQLQVQEGQLTLAVKHLEAAVQAIPNHEAFRLGLAQAYTLLGEPDKAQAQRQAVAALH
jgi:tetratricopeptide (TPR) repeat protein